MFQQTPQKRVLFPRTLAIAAVGGFVVFILLSAFMALRPQPVRAATNSTLSFQARLENTAGNIVPDGFYNVQFKIYNGGTAGGPAGKGQANAGTNLWTETWYDSNGATAGNDNRIQVRNGYLSANLGSQNAFPSINWDEELWITMNIGGTTQTATPTWDGEMSPRLKLTGVPYAFKAGQLATTNAANDFTSTLSLIQPTVGNQVFQIQDQGAAGTYNLCVQNSTACGFAAATGGAGYIQNQSAAQQTSSTFWISGNGRSDTALQAPSFDTPTAVALNIGTTNATSIVLGKTGVNTRVAANLSVGTTQSFGAITVANDAWFSSVDSAGTGSINMFKVNSSNQIQVGAALNVDGGIILPTNGGQMTLVDLGIDSGASNGAKQSYTLRVGSTNALTVYGEADGAGNAQNVRIAIGSSITPAYTLDVGGDINTSGNVRSGGTIRLDSSGNLSNIGTITSGLINGQTISSTANFTGTVGVATSVTTPIVQNSSANLTLQTTTSGNIILNSAGTIELQDNTNVTGNLTLTGTLSTPNQNIISLTRTLPTTVGNAVDIGSFVLTNGAGNMTIDVTIPSSAFSVAKHYTIPIYYHGTAGTWQTVQAANDTGPWTGNDVTLELNINSQTASLRLRRSTGTTAGTAYITITHQGVAADAFTPSSGTGAVTAPTVFYSAAFASQFNNTFSIQGDLTVQNSGNFNIGGQQVISNTRVLQNVTTDTGILTSGTLGVARGGTGLATATLNGVVFGNGTGALGVTAAGTTGQCLIATTSAAPSWGSCGPGTTYTAGNDLDLTGTTFDIEPQLDFVTTISRASSNLTLQTTTSGNIILNSAGTIELQDNTNVTGNLEISGTSRSASRSLSVTSYGVAAEGSTNNLLYGSGTSNGLSGGANITSGTTTYTSLGNGKYRIATSAGGGGTIRLYTNLATLTNGANYANSIAFENNTGTVTVDWADVALTGSGSSAAASGRIFGYASKATYDSTYRFMDINLSASSTVDVYDPQVEAGTVATSFTPGARGVGDIIARGNIVTTDGGLQVGTNTVITSGAVLQNVTASAGILTSGTLASSVVTGSYTGITAVGTLTGIKSTGNLYIDTNAFGGSSIIDLAVGDTDTGFDSAGDGMLNVYANNANVFQFRGTAVNSTVALQTGGTTRIDTSGNLSNIGTITSGLINGQTISSAANFTGTVGVATSVTTPIVQNSSANLTLQTTTSGNIILNSAGTIELQDNTNVTGSLAVSANVSVTGGVNAKGYVTTNTSSTSSGQWTKLATCTITVQYQDCRTQATLVSTADGGSSDRATIDIRVKQQNAMAGVPYISLQMYDSQNITTSDVSAVTVTNDATSTVVELWGRVNAAFRTWNMNPLINTGSVPFAWASNQGYQVSLPAGTATSSTYAAITTTSVTASGDLVTSGGKISVGGQDVITAARVLQNVTADTGILTSGTLGVARGGTGLATATLNGVVFGNGTGALGVTAAGTTGQCLIATTSAAPSWGSCGPGTTYTAGNDLDLTGTTFDIEPQLDFVTTISRASSNLTLQTTTSGNIILNSAGTIELQDNTNVTGSLSASTSVLTPTLDTASAVALNIGTTNATAINLNKNVTVAAGQYISLVGGITSTRPASPTDGMLYYDTTTKQLLVYDATSGNAHWKADRSSSTLVVGTSASGSGAIASKAPDGADYVNTSTTSAQTTINTAITSLGTTGGTVYLMEGTYIVDGSISVANNVTLVGAGSKATIIKLKNSTGAVTVPLITNTDQVTGNNITLRDFKLDGNKANNASGTFSGIDMTNVGSGSGSSAVTGITVRNVESVDNNTNGMKFTALANSSFTDVVTQNNTNDGFTGSSTSSIASVTFNNFSALANGNTGLGISGSTSNVTVTNSRIESNTNIGINMNAGTGTTNVNNTFTGNIIKTNGSIGMQVSSGGGTSGNHTITGNIIINNTSRGINVSSSNDNTITGNQITGNTSDGIRLTSANKNIISGNRIHDSASTTAADGINLTTSDGNLIMNNTITDTAGTGSAIEIVSGTSNYLSGNTYSGTGATAIVDTGTTTIYANQANASGQLVNTASGALVTRLQSGSSADLFQAQDSSGNALFKIGSTGTLTVGRSNGASGTTGVIVVSNGANNNTVTITSGTTSSSYQLTLPTALGASGDCIKDTTGTGVLGFAACGGASAPTFQDVYTNSTSPATLALSTDAKNFVINAADTSTTDPSIVFNLQCTTCSASGGRFAVQDAGTDIFLVNPDGSIRIGTATNNVTFAASTYLPTHNGNARTTKSIKLAPEYPGAVLTGTSTAGTMTSDFCSHSARRNVNATVCGTTGDEHNYYEWSSTASGETYDIYISYRMPSDFDGFASSTSINMSGWRTDVTVNSVKLSLFNSSGNECGTASGTEVAGTAVWATTALGGDETALANCTAIVADQEVVFRVRVVADTGDTVRAGAIYFNYKSKF